MDNTILQFLEAYKKLDILCKQTLSSNIGISTYIVQMQTNIQGHLTVPGWNDDFKYLKKLRRMRNCLVHEPDSYNNVHLTQNDIIWLEHFYSRIMEQTDPLSLLYQDSIQKEHYQSVPHSTAYSHELEGNESDTKQFVKSIFVALFLALFIIAIFLILLYLY